MRVLTSDWVTFWRAVDYPNLLANPAQIVAAFSGSLGQFGSTLINVGRVVRPKPIKRIDLRYGHAAGASSFRRKQGIARLEPLRANRHQTLDARGCEGGRAMKPYLTFGTAQDILEEVGISSERYVARGCWIYSLTFPDRPLLRYTFISQRRQLIES